MVQQRQQARACAAQCLTPLPPIATYWTAEKLQAGFAALHADQYDREGGKAQTPAGDADADFPQLLTVLPELKRHVTADMATAAGHEKRPLLRVIRAKCIECTGGSRHEVALCSCIDCPSWPYRFGRNPFSSRKLSDEQKAELSERMRAMAAERAEAKPLTDRELGDEILRADP